MTHRPEPFDTGFQSKRWYFSANHELDTTTGKPGGGSDLNFCFLKFQQMGLILENLELSTNSLRNVYRNVLVSQMVFFPFTVLVDLNLSPQGLSCMNGYVPTK